LVCRVRNKSKNQHNRKVFFITFLRLKGEIDKKKNTPGYILLSPSRTGLQEMVKTLPNLVQIFESKYVKLNALFFLKKGLIIIK